MKRQLLLLALCICSFSAFSQKKEIESKTEVIPCSDFHLTKPLWQIMAAHPADENAVRKEEEESKDKEHRKPHHFEYTVEDGPQYGNDQHIMQNQMGSIPGKAPITNWAGQTATGFRPFDPSGASGPNHYVQMINSTTFKVYNKVSGVVMLTATLGNLWSPATGNSGDPIVLYDKPADRWLLAQFGNSTDKKIYIAISQTGDPTGAYYTYTFVSPQFPDYLKFSTWHDGYYMTSNQGTQKVFCFERSAMLTGSASARSLYTTYSPPNGSGFFVPLAGDASDGVLPAAGTPCPILSYSDNGWGASYSDAVNIYNMSVNWVPVTPTATITLASNLATSSFDASYDVNWNDIDQPGTAQKLDGIGGTLMYRAQWRSWSGYNTVVLNWGVKITSTHRSIMWCELRQNQTSGVWSIYQQGIYNPDSTSRWMGSIAMDVNGSIALAYLKSDAVSVYPTLCYAGRRSCDPLGTLPIAETVAIAGTGSQTGINRVGDYSQTMLDPDGITFWHTGEYMGGPTGSSAARTQIFSFQLASCTNAANVNIAVTGGSNPSCSGSSVTFTATPTNGGTTPVYQWKVNGANVGTNSPTYTTTSLTNGQIVTCVMTSNLPGVTNNPATSNAITMTVNAPSPSSVSIAASATTICAGASVTFTATPTNGGTTPVYQWKVDGVNVGTNSATYTTTTLTNGQVVTCTMTSNSTCTSNTSSNSNSITITVTSGAQSVSITTSSTTICAGTAVTFTATGTNVGTSPVYQWKLNGSNVGTNSPTYSNSSLPNGAVVTCTLNSYSTCLLNNTLGTGTGTNATNSDAGVAYPTYYGNGRQQYLIKASELTVLGFSAGQINALGFTINSTVGNPSVMNGFTIKMASTAATVLTSTFQAPTFSTVLGPVNFTPTVNSLNTHNLVTPFTWDGSSNVLIDICFSNQVVGTVAYQNYQTTSTFVSSTYYQADGAAGAGACTTTTGTAVSVRPNTRITLAPLMTSNSNAITMTVNPAVVPAVSISATATTICAGTSVTFTATPTNGGAAPAYQWKVNGANVGTNSSTYATTALTNGQVVTCVLTSNANCASPSTATSSGITMTVNPVVVPAVSISATATTICAGTSVTFTATPTNGGATPAYQWKVNGANVGTNSATYATTALTNGQVVTCVLTSNANCASPSTATSSGITMTVNPVVVPAISISATATTICAGTSVTFTATPTNGGATPAYQWKVNGANVGTNSATYATTALTNGQVVTCVLTSNANCASPSTATSSGITMTVNPVVVPAISISATATTICAGTSVTFTATPTNGGATPAYQWKVNGANVGTNSATYATTALTNGQVVTCVLTSNANCASPSTATSTGITMTVNPVVVPAISISATATTICAGTSVTFTATPTNGGATPAYQWKVNGANVGTNSATYATTALTNGQVVTCVLTSNANCASPSTATSSGITMTVNPVVVPAVNISATATTICAGTSVTFTATPTNGGATPAYQWKVNGANVGTNSATYATTALTNGQVVTCVLTSNANCASPSTATSSGITMTVNPVVVPAVSISATATTICAGTSVTFTATPTNGGATPAYQWKVNGANVGTNSATYATTALTNGQVVTCVLTSNANCASPSTATSSGITMTVNPVVVPAVSISATATTICAGTSVTFTATPTNGGATPAYQWKVNGANVGTNSATYATTALTNGQVVTCVLTSNANCASPSTATSNGITMTVTTCSVSLNLKAYLEGYYISGGLMNKTLYFEGVDPSPVSTLVDTITVLLRKPTAPYTVAGTYKGIIQTNGTITCTFPPSLLGNSYYIVVTHRNTLTTWSANPVLMSASTIYDFTTAASKAYGNNQVQVGPSIWAMYTGDVVSDENVDLLDIGSIQNDIVLFGFGYMATDINGDGNVDLLDQPLVENNVSNFIFSDHP